MKKQGGLLLTIIFIIITTISITNLVFAALSNEIYTDSTSEATFNIPVGWTRQPLSGEKDITKVKYTYDTDEYTYILYGSKDLWNMLSSEEREGYDRIDFNANNFPLYDFYEDIVENRADISVKKYNGYDYYIATYTTTHEFNGMTVSFKNTVFNTMVNGYVYNFQFVGSTDSQPYLDFIELLNSASLGDLPSNYTGSVAETKSDFEPYMPGMIFLPFFLIIIVVLSICIVVYFKFRKKKSKIENIEFPLTHEQSKKKKLKYYSELDDDVPMAFLKFYIYVRMPLSIIRLLAEIVMNGFNSLYFLDFVVFSVYIIACIGLHKRLYWGYKLNKVFLIINTLYPIFCVLIVAYIADFVGKNVYTIIGQYIGVFIGQLIWNIPSYIYFEKRRNLFTSSTLSNESNVANNESNTVKADFSVYNDIALKMTTQTDKEEFLIKGSSPIKDELEIPPSSQTDKVLSNIEENEKMEANNAIKCKKCGTAIAENYKFCPNCKKRTHKRTIKKHIITSAIISLLSLFIVVSFACTIMFYIRYDQANDDYYNLLGDYNKLQKENATLKEDKEALIRQRDRMQEEINESTAKSYTPSDNKKSGFNIRR